MAMPYQTTKFKSTAMGPTAKFNSCQYFRVHLHVSHRCTKMSVHMYKPDHTNAYFLKFFPRVLLISRCANMRVQFKGGDTTRAGTINIAILPHSYAHCPPSRFSPNECETWT